MLSDERLIELYGGLPREFAVNAEGPGGRLHSPAICVEGGGGLPFYVQGGVNSPYAQLSHVVWRFRMSSEHPVVCVSQCGAADVERSFGFHWGDVLSYLARRDIEVLDKSGFEKAVVYGSSLGALAAINLAALYPERVAAVIAVNPAGLIRQNSWWLVWKFLKAMSVEVKKDFVPPPTARPSNLDLLQGLFGQVRGIAASDVGLGLLAQVRCPTLIYTGRQDEVFPWWKLEELASRFPKVSVMKMEEFGHSEPNTRWQVNRVGTHAKRALRDLRII